MPTAEWILDVSELGIDTILVGASIPTGSPVFSIHGVRFDVEENPLFSPE